ncbi:TIGR02679 family protein [Streptomyces sp. NBC_01485]|uniref:TIGR02679 family protein n=1 Tax=Streptomyces sp. NBC_01485 TaxID=2903884 RepID=UPI002E321DFF|nr:TIGR02679 family protein [Streptomyces sp. NBC_01485]
MSAAPIPPRLPPLLPPHLTGPRLRPLWQAVHDRLSSGRPVSGVRLGPLDDDEREALADLLGMDRLPDQRPTVRLTRLEDAVAEAGGGTVRDLVTQVIGPLGDRDAERRRRDAERSALWSWLASHDTVRAEPALTDWTTYCRTQGLVDGSVTRTRDLLSAALAVLAALPAEGEPLPVFAARVRHGDPHALDDGTRLSSLVLRALSTLYGTPVPDRSHARRELWSRAGVADDDLSTTVLAAGLRPSGEGTLSRLGRICSDAGHAVSLTLAQVRSPGEFGFPVRAVHITENPSVLALALRRFGPHCPPLVCTSGWPNSAAVRLLHLLAAAGATLHYHGDFDGEGIRIAAHVMHKTPAVPWRMTTHDYLTAVTDTALTDTPQGPSPGRLTEAPWDPTLTTAMAAHGRAVMEETVTDTLLDDLSRETGSPMSD